MKRIKINEVWVTVANYKEPLRPVPDGEGFGYYGTLLMTPDGEYVMCSKCGQLCRDLGRHVLNSHKEFETVREYRDEFGLAYTTSLLSEVERINRKQRMLEYLASLSPAQLKARKDAAANGRKHRTNYQPKIQLETKNKRGHCPDQILDKIQQVTDMLGRTPSLKEFMHATGGQRYKRLVFSTFGSWLNALNLLELEPKPNIPGRGVERYSEEYLLESLVNYAITHNKIPTASDCRSGILPRWETYKRRFGSLVKARELAGVDKYVQKVRKSNYRDRTEYQRNYRLKRKLITN